ncbi:unnamed protein product [Effrenium voratum]|uniref:Glycosyltransferase n=1 Tax=Effrenium voratum TaxID=2562239 RepID=A0AA36INL0_9DINO|nr:unnamed protein product [Effrenium voratum]CAJ1412833.1 unnamed protein product [Effrenium voratum]
MTAKSNGTSCPGRVLVYSHSWLPQQVDGVAVRMMAHVNAMRKRGVKVLLVTPDFVMEGENKEVPKFDISEGIEHVTLRTQKTPVYRKNMCMSMAFSNLRVLVQAIQRFQPDLVHATQEASLQVVVTACIYCAVPLTVSLHTDVAQIAARDDGFSSIGGSIGRLHSWISVRMVHWGYRNWALGGANFFPVSQQSLVILRNAGVSEQRVAPIIWGPMVDRDQFRVDLPEDSIVQARKKLTFGMPESYLMVYVGRVTAEKDIQFLLDGHKRAPKHVVLALIGPGSMADELKQFHGEEHRLYCTGELASREEVALFLRAADLHVSASRMETVGFTAMESISCGTPMLAANAQGFAMYLTHGVNARLFTPGSTESYDRELAEMMATKLEGKWSRESLRSTMEMASIDACTDRAFQAYLTSPAKDWRYIRLVVSLFYFVLNWFCSIAFQ